MFARTTVSAGTSTSSSPGPTTTTPSGRISFTRQEVTISAFPSLSFFM